MTAGARLPFDKDRRMTVLDVRRVGDMTVSDYALQGGRRPIGPGSFRRSACP
ncbi:MAG: hypothetical protein ACLR76_07955 [Alistipes sp.]